MAARHALLTDNERGASLVEMAFAMLFLALLLAGVVDVSRAFYSHIALTNAAREGARYGSRFPYHATGIREAVIRDGPVNSLGDTAVTNIAIACTTASGSNIACASVSSGGYIRVTATVGNLDTIMSNVLGVDGFVLRSSTTMIVFGVD